MLALAILRWDGFTNMLVKDTIELSISRIGWVHLHLLDQISQLVADIFWDEVWSVNQLVAQQVLGNVRTGAYDEDVKGQNGAEDGCSPKLPSDAHW